MPLLSVGITPSTNPTADALVSHQITNAPFPNTAVPSVLHPNGLKKFSDDNPVFSLKDNGPSVESADLTLLTSKSAWTPAANRNKIP